jgi:nicotinate-nucleotide adenylyltransferase
MTKLFLGGSFNPIHLGHLICARAAAESIGAPSVVLIPTGVPPHKQSAKDIASPQDRLEMARRAIENIPRFEVDDREIRRPGPSYTIQTARELRQSGIDRVNWLIGADMLNTLPTWHEPAALLAEVHFIIMARPGSAMNWESLPPEYARLRDHVVQVPRIDISATEIRRRIKAGLPIDFLTPPGVCRYIEDRKLFR